MNETWTTQHNNTLKINAIFDNTQMTQKFKLKHQKSKERIFDLHSKTKYLIKPAIKPKKTT